MFWWRDPSLHRPPPHAGGGEGEPGESHGAGDDPSHHGVSFCRASGRNG